MNAVLVGCVQIDNPDSAARTVSRELGECPRNSGNCWACREFLRTGPIWGLSREEAMEHPAPPEVGPGDHSLPINVVLALTQTIIMQGNSNIDDTSVFMNNMMNVKDTVVQVDTTHTHTHTHTHMFCDTH